MSKKGWKILTVVFAGAGVIMLLGAYLPVLFPMDVNIYHSDKADGYIQDGTPQSSSYTALVVSKKGGDVTATCTSFIYFYTSSIPNNAVITSAKLKLNVGMMPSSQSYMSLIVLWDSDKIYPHKPYRSGDEKYSNYDGGKSWVIPKQYVGKWASVNIPTHWINKDGWTKLALYAPQSGTAITFASANAGYDYRPRLEITYTIPKYHLTVKTNPSYCDVTVAGQTKNSGTSGATFYLTQGTYKVTVSKEGYITKTTTVYLNGDKTITVTLEPEVHEYTLTVYTTPTYCTVEVHDGDTWTANSGENGECTFTLEQGTYIVTVSKDGYQADTQTIQLNSNKTIYVTLQPEINEHVLTVYVDPTVATVEVGGQTKIVPSTGFVEFTLEEGTYTVTVYKDGYNTITRQINLNQDMELHISLTPQRPDIAITHYMNVIGLTMLLLAIPCGVKGWYL